MRTERPHPFAKALLGLANLVVVLSVAVFVPAGTVRDPQGWAFLAVWTVCCVGITAYLMRHDPKLLERRTQAGPTAESRTSQKRLQLGAGAAFLALVVVPSLDRRFGWSHVPLACVVAGDAVVALGFGLVFWVFKSNTFASATVEVAADQKVIDTGPYRLVRHPMYGGALVLLAGIPLALGSYWGLLMLAPMVALLALRLLDEEALLSKDLRGYDAYRRKVRWRLVPGLW